MALAIASPTSTPGWWVPAATVSPGRGFSTQPSGTIRSMELKKPSFLGIAGSIIEAICATT